MQEHGQFISQGCGEALKPAEAPSTAPACIQPAAAPRLLLLERFWLGSFPRTNHILRVTRFCFSFLTLFSQSLGKKRLSSSLPPTARPMKDFFPWLSCDWDSRCSPGGTAGEEPWGGDGGCLHGAAPAERGPAVVQMMCTYKRFGAVKILKMMPQGLWWIELMKCIHVFYLT